MNLVCSTRNLIIGVAIIVLLLICFYLAFASPLLLFAVAIPLILAIAFLALWGLTTTTSLTNFNKLFLLVYVVSLIAIESAAWWTLRDNSPSQVAHANEHMEVQDEKYRG